MIHPVAHCMPIYLLGSLQYFADVRRARGCIAPSEGVVLIEHAPEDIIPFPAKSLSTTPQDSHCLAEVTKPHPSGVVAGREGEGR